MKNFIASVLTAVLLASPAYAQVISDLVYNPVPTGHYEVITAEKIKVYNPNANKVSAPNITAAGDLTIQGATAVGERFIINGLELQNKGTIEADNFEINMLASAVKPQVNANNFNACVLQLGTNAIQLKKEGSSSYATIPATVPDKKVLRWRTIKGWSAGKTATSGTEESFKILVNDSETSATACDSKTMSTSEYQCCIGAGEDNCKKNMKSTIETEAANAANVVCSF
ncbi:hypothetical protein Dip510_001801 [Elusimicrobium posterum]|uniref:hypothetical protein n=1 Tax=Elusimicrobium posterum TaxID=3116653 RepID=UPI003C73A6A1